MSIELLVRVDPDKADKVKKAIQSAGGEIVVETPVQDTVSLTQIERQRRILAFLEAFKERGTQTTDVAEKIREGYEKLLTDIKHTPHWGDKELSRDVSTKELQGVFMETATDQNLLGWAGRHLVSLIYAYGLQDGIERNRNQIAQILGYKNTSAINLSFGRSILYDRLAERFK